VTSALYSNLTAALDLNARGFWSIAIHPKNAVIKNREGRERIASGKEPIGAAWGADRWSYDKLHQRFRTNPGAGVGVCLGPGRAPRGEWLIDLEGDGENAGESLYALLRGKEVATAGWSSTRGGHNLFTADGERLLALLAKCRAEALKGEGKVGVLKLAELPDLELRIGGYHPNGNVKQTQSVVPPTVGTDGKPRKWSGALDVAALPEAAYAFLEAIAEQHPSKAGANHAAGNGNVLPPSIANQATHEGNGFTHGSPFANPPTGATVEERAIAYLDTIDPAISGQGGSVPTFRAACTIGPGFDLTPATTLRLLLTHYNPRCVPPWSEGEMRHKVEDAYKVETRRGWLLNSTPPGRSAPSPGGSAPMPANRPMVILTTDRHVVEAESVEVLRNDAELFSRGDVLGIVVEESGTTTTLPGGIVLRGGCSRFLPLSKDCLSGRMTRLIEFRQWRVDKSKKNVLMPAHPPDYLVGMMMTRGQWPVRRLLGIASAPWVRPDGSLPDPGFDDQTGTLFRPTGDLAGLLANLPGSPDQDDARAAADRLFDVVRDFPFASDDDRAVWLAALLTAIQRPAIPGAIPGIVLNGNKAGTGKGLLIDVIGIAQSGAPIPTRPYPKDPPEAGKVTLSLALAGVMAVHFDNLTSGRYGSSELDSALTSTVVSGRILGASKESGPIPLRPCWFISGNSLSPGRDAFRRWLPCNLKTTLENPHERADVTEGNLRHYVASHRGELLRHVLVILKAHALAGRPVCGKARLGSFEEWDLNVRGAVAFATGGDLGGPGLDCLATQRAATAESPEFAEKRALLDAWAAVPGAGHKQEGMTCARAREIAEHIPATKGQPMILTRYPDLRNALLEMSRDGKLPSSSTIGYRIRGMKHENVGGRCFEVAGNDRGIVLWRVANV